MDMGALTFSALYCLWIVCFGWLKSAKMKWSRNRQSYLLILLSAVRWNKSSLQMNAAASMHRIDVIYLNDKGESLAEGEPHQSYTCITLQWCSESRKETPPIPMDKHLNSNVQVINHHQYTGGEDYNRTNVNIRGWIFFTFCLKY